MAFKAKKFDELSLNELYEILKSRTEIFLLEQSIVCQDMDDVDYNSLHCFMWQNGRVIAYLRAFCEEENSKTVTVGRVLTLNHGEGIGTMLMQKSMEEIKKQFDCNKITLHAQKQASGFYEKLGFVTVSDEFLEEGVIHISMEIDLI